MQNKESLYEAFAELSYAVAISDGVVEQEEIDAVVNASKDHPIQKMILTQFHSKNLDASIAQSYKNILDIHRDFRLVDEYPFLINIIEELAKKSIKDVSELEESVIGAVLEGLKKKLM